MLDLRRSKTFKIIGDKLYYLLLMNVLTKLKTTLKLKW